MPVLREAGKNLDFRLKYFGLLVLKCSDLAPKMFEQAKCGVGWMVRFQFTESWFPITESWFCWSGILISYWESGWSINATGPGGRSHRAGHPPGALQIAFKSPSNRLQIAFKLPSNRLQIAFKSPYGGPILTDPNDFCGHPVKNLRQRLMNFCSIMMILGRPECAKYWRGWRGDGMLPYKMMNFCIKNDEFCIKNGEFCIKNDELCIQNDELCIIKVYCASGDPGEPQAPYAAPLRNHRRILIWFSIEKRWIPVEKW